MKKKLGFILLVAITLVGFNHVNAEETEANEEASVKSVKSMIESSDKLVAHDLENGISSGRFLIK